MLLMRGGSLQVLGMKMKAYMPDFSRAFEHFCIHTGGRGVIDGMEKQLGLTRAHMQPTRDALFRYGNVSSSSIWCAILAGLPAGLLHENKVVTALLLLTASVPFAVAVSCMSGGLTGPECGAALP